LIHAPDEQNAPVLSVENECATSGELPPRAAAMILSSSTPPRTFTVIFGFFLWKSSVTPLITPSSRSEKPVQSVIVTGLPSYVAAALSPDESSSPPMHPDAPSATAPATTAMTARLRPPSTPSLRPNPTAVRNPIRSHLSSS
jgi:hypothetical protein